MLNLKKDNWIKYRFDEIAQNISEHVDPKSTDLDIYVGLEHLDSESIHIKRHGHPTDVKGTKLKVYKGDVIFGKRRAYQKKAATVDFDGICSAHSMVLRANQDVILQELFPFFLHSDSFMHRAVDISEGSLSPTIKWNILAKQEFFIPPKKGQNDIFNLLETADRLNEALISKRQKIVDFKIIRSKELLLKGIGHKEFKKTEIGTIPKKWEIVKLSEIADVGAGNGAPQDQELFEGGKYPFCRTSDVGRVHISDNLVEITDLLNKEGIKGLSLYKKGTILLPKSGASTFLNHRVILGVDSYVSNHLATIVADEKLVLTKILFNILLLIDAKNICNNSDYPSLGTNMIKDILLALPPLDEQKKIASIMDELDKTIKDVVINEHNLFTLKKALINSIF